MSFQKQLNKAIKESGLTAKQISLSTGISQSRISDFRHGSIPKDEQKQLLEDFLGFSCEEEIKPKDTVRIEEAAALMGLSLDSLKLALQNNIFNPQIGVAVKHKGGTWTYTIFPTRMKKYLAGEI